MTKARREDPVATELFRITIAANDADLSAAFYGLTFGVRFSPIELAGHTLHRGALGAMGLMICPIALAGVDARETRHQLALIVDDVADVVDRARRAGGTTDDGVVEQGGRRTAVVRDPDGSPIELVERPRGREG